MCSQARVFEPPYPVCENKLIVLGYDRSEDYGYN